MLSSVRLASPAAGYVRTVIETRITLDSVNPTFVLFDVAPDSPAAECIPLSGGFVVLQGDDVDGWGVSDDYAPSVSANGPIGSTGDGSAEPYERWRIGLVFGPGSGDLQIIGSAVYITFVP